MMKTIGAILSERMLIRRQGSIWVDNVAQMMFANCNRLVGHFCSDLPTLDTLVLPKMASDSSQVVPRYISDASQILDFCYKSRAWLSSTCTCPTFSKTYICKHILAIGILNKEFKVKPEAKSSEGDLAKKRPRGRPKKVPYALVTD